MKSLSSMYVKAQVIIGLTVLLGFFSIAVILLFRLAPESNVPLLKEMIEGLVPLMILVLQAFFQKHTNDPGDNPNAVPTTTINASSGTTVNHTASNASQPPAA